MGSRRIIYPRGFSRVLTENVLPENDGDIEIIDADAHIEQLFTWYKRRGQHKWDFQSLVLHTAAQYFDTTLQRWFREQITNPYVYDYNMSFIEDTARFILHGTRSVSPWNWIELLQDRPIAHEGASYSRMFTKVTNQQWSQLTLQNWIGQDNGFNDLAVSLYVIFGAEKPKPDDDPGLVKR